MIISQMFRLMGGDGVDCYRGFMNEANDRTAVVAEAIQQYIPGLHEINNRALYPDDVLTVESGEVDEYDQPILTSETVPITRIPLSIEKDIINKKAIFAYGGGIILEPNKESSKLFETVEKNFYDTKLDLMSKEVLTDCMASTQAAIIFYAPDNFKGVFKYKIVSPLKGDTLYPFYDEDTGDFIAFGREYKSKDKTRFDLYVKNESGFVEIRRYVNGVPRFVQGTALMPSANGLVQVDGEVADVFVSQYTKLPVIYMEQAVGECHDIHPLRKNYEVAYSGFWDQNDRTGDPILFGTGDTLSLPAKGKRGKYIEGSADADLKFITPENATESRALQFKMAEGYMYSLCNSVKFDLETFKGAGVTSGEAIDKLLTPMFLDAKEKQDGILGMFYQRLINWLIHETRNALSMGEEDLSVYVKFRPMSFKSDKEQVELSLLANGNRPVMTHYESIVMAGLSSDPKQTLEELKTIDNSSNNE